jgi:hypothetical protein
LVILKNALHAGLVQTFTTLTNSHSCDLSFFGLVYDFFFITGASEGLMRFLKISGGEGMRSVPGLVELRRHEL